MMTAERLKASILQLAIQGKLVEQRLEEGTGEALYKQIQTEKAKLIKEGKIKKEKLLPQISQNEIPFEIPNSWKWVRVNDLLKSKTDGIHFAPKYINSGIPCYSAKDIYDDKIHNDNCKYICIEDYYDLMKEKIQVEKGSLLFTKSGSIGRSSVIEHMYQFGLVESVGVLNFIFVDPRYIKVIFDYGFVFSTNLFDQYTKGIAVKHLTLALVGGIAIPLPPLDEQKRIVDRIEELMPFVEKYATASTKLNTLNASFPDMLKKSILQEGVQGKLIPQNPSDEPASELLKRIAKEKERLVKEGKIKKEKPLPEIAEDKIPFDIPESWKWVRLEELVTKNVKRGKSPSYAPNSSTLVFAQKCNTKAGNIDITLAKFLDDNKLSKYPDEEFMQDKDIVINSTGNGTLGRVGLYRDSDNPRELPIVPDSHVTVIRVGHAVSVLFMVNVLKYYQPYLEKLGTGSTNQTELSASTIRALLIPLPPFAEQERIVAKIEELMSGVGELVRYNN